MISFSTLLTRAFNKDAPQPYWVMRLYYDDESSFTGISDLYRSLDGNDYFALAGSGWGRLGQILDIDQFRTSQGVFSVALINTENSIEGGRFSDLWASRGYVGRKWELFQCDVNAAFDSGDQLATGYITNDISHNDTNFTLRLVDMWGKYNIDIPKQRADKDTFPKVPDENKDEPLPMFYGDASYKPNVRAVTDFQKHLVKAKVPALIVDAMDVDGNIVALPDTNQDPNVVLNQLNAKNVFIYNSSQYLSCVTVNVTTATGAGDDHNPADNTENWIKCTGVEWVGLYVFGAVTSDGLAKITDEENMVDKNFLTSGNMECAAGEAQTMTLKPPITPKISRATKVEFIIDNGTVTGDPNGDDQFGIVVNEFLWAIINWASDQVDVVDYTLAYTDEQLEDGDLSGAPTALRIDDGGGGGGGDIDINWIGFQITYTPNMDFHTGRRPRSGGHPRIPVVLRPAEIDVAPKDIQYLYVGGKGREYDSWIDDGRDQGYDEDELIENPVFAIEDFIRNEMGLATAGIDVATFDAAGDTDSGDLLDTFGEDDTDDIKFVFSIYQIVKAKKAIEGICRQAGLYFWFGPNKAKIKARRRTYTVVDATIKWNHINIKSIKKTDLDAVKNRILVKYEYDYGTQQTVLTRDYNDNASLEDGTSQANGSGGYGDSSGDIVRQLDLEVPYIADITTADNIGEAYVAFLKDTKAVIKFATTSARYNHLEIGDVINFSGWNANYKVFGLTPTTAHGWMITNTSKLPDGATIEVTRVPGTIS